MKWLFKTFQGSASEATLVGLLAAREITVNRVKKDHPGWDDGKIRSKLIAYTSGNISYIISIILVYA